MAPVCVSCREKSFCQLISDFVFFFKKEKKIGIGKMGQIFSHPENFSSSLSVWVPPQLVSLTVGVNVITSLAFVKTTF